MNNETTQPTRVRRVSPTEFGKLVGLSKWKVYRLIESRTIPFIKLGARNGFKVRVLIDPVAAIEALERRYGIPARPVIR